MKMQRSRLLLSAAGASVAMAFGTALAQPSPVDGRSAQQPGHSGAERSPATPPPAVAPASPAGDPAATRHGQTTSSATSSSDWERSHRASRIIGADVHNTQGKKIGDISDVVVDRNGRVFYVVTLDGSGDRLYAVPRQSMTAQSGRYVLGLEGDRLKSAPSFDSRNWSSMGDEKYAEQLERFYGSYQGVGGMGSSPAGAPPSAR